MRPQIHGLGWFVRRSPDPDRLVAFYRDVIGFPILRRHGVMTAFWTGETAVLETFPGGQAAPPFASYRDSPLSPVFRVVSMERVAEKLKAQKVRFLAEPFERQHAIVAFALDPDGFPVGMAEHRRTSDHPNDIEAWRRWDSGRLGIAGVGSLPPHFQHLGWVVLRGSDVVALTAFYRNVIGLDFLYSTEDSRVLSLGDSTVLEIAPGVPPRQAPADRTEVPVAFVLRVDDVDGLSAELAAAGVHFVNPPFDVEGGRIAYFADPEGHVVGMQTRAPGSQRVEDQEAALRVERQRRGH